MTASDDREQIDEVIASFFEAFDNRNSRVPLLEKLTGLFAPGAIVVRDTGSRCERYSVLDFAQPRLELLAGGELVEFHEWETESSTQVVGLVAVRASRYRKEGILKGQPYRGSGRKFFQFGKFDAGWLITAVAWSDDA
jgi:hypothetical protein